MNSANAYTILRDLLAETAPYTGEAFLKASVKAFAKPFNADFVFITEALEEPADTVRMMAAWRDGGEVAGWEFALPGTPCELIYHEGPHDSWEGLRIGHGVAIPKEVRARFASTKDTPYQAFIGMPLWSGERKMIGHVALFFNRDLGDNAERSFIVELVELFSYKVQAELNRMLIERAREETLAELQRANERLARDSITDFLTQLYNRRYFNQRAQEAFARFNRLDEHYALVLLDLDHFKQINDAYGHDAGDTVLRQVARVFLECTRADVESVFRIGGEEFAILCHGPISKESLLGFGGRLNRAVRSTKFAAGDRTIPVTVSIGAALPNADDPSWDAIYLRADKALYAAKNEGRDRTIAD
jgi:diguanylate cyclase (GGDEF)-like protein